MFYKFQLIKDFNQDFNAHYINLKSKFDKSEILSIMKLKTVNFLNKKKSNKLTKEIIKNDNLKPINIDLKNNEDSGMNKLCKSVSNNDIFQKFESKNINSTSNYYKNYSIINNSTFHNLIKRIELNNYDIFCYLISFLKYRNSSKIKIMENLLDYKRKILSEEEIFSTHYLLKSLQNNLINNIKYNNFLFDKQSL